MQYFPIYTKKWNPIKKSYKRKKDMPNTEMHSNVHNKNLKNLYLFKSSC